MSSTKSLASTSVLMMNGVGVSVDVFSLDIEDPLLLKEVLRICRLYMANKWPLTNTAQVKLQRLSGLTNYVFKVYADDESPPLCLRIHGSSGSELVIESVTAAILAERNFGPPLLGIFPEGRLEQFILSDKLSSRDIRQKDISLKVAQKMAGFHKLMLPVMKSQWLLLNTCGQVYSLVPQLIPFNDKQKEIINILKDFDYKSEIEFMKSKLAKSMSPIVFCHNDLQEGNMLIRHDNGDLVFIDYEYSCYNYRNFDIVNHFLEWTADYELPQPPFFTIDQSLFPSKNEQECFIRQYLTASNEECNIESTIAEIISEIPLFVAYSHLFYSCWGIAVQHHRPEEDWGYMEYTYARYMLYLESKQKLLQSCTNSAGDH